MKTKKFLLAVLAIVVGVSTISISVQAYIYNPPTTTSGTLTSVSTNNGLTGGPCTTTCTVGLNTTNLSPFVLSYWDGSNEHSTSSPTVGYITATSTTATSTFVAAVAVGSTTPYSKLAVTAQPGDLNTTIFQVASSTVGNVITYPFSVFPSGTVGIGTTTALDNFDIQGVTGSNTVVNIITPGTANTAELRLSQFGISSTGLDIKHYGSNIGSGLNNTAELWNFDSGGNSGFRFGGSGGEVMRLNTISLLVGIGSSTPTATLQVTAAASNATTSLEFGKIGQNKGTCLTYFDDAGTPVYAHIATGATAFTISATQFSGCQK